MEFEIIALRVLTVTHISGMKVGKTMADTICSGRMPWVAPQIEKPDFHVPASFGVLELVD